jgi:flagellar motility protein MotE (MotC chaperone)
MLLFITAFIAGILYGAYRFNLFGMGNINFKSIREKLPIANNLILPDDSKPDAEELSLKISELEGKIKSLEEEKSDLEKRNELYAQEVLRLKEFESQQLEFRAEKEEFDRMIASEKPSEYEKFYSQISPENAEIIYREIVGEISSSKEFKKYISTFQNMDESAAAGIFEKMVSTDIDLVVSILKALPAEQSASVLAAMKPESAAMATKRMYPEN